jgi:hypothetical protein
MADSMRIMRKNTVDDEKKTIKIMKGERRDG